MDRVSRAWRVARQEGVLSFWFKLCSALGYRRLWLYEIRLAEFSASFPLPDNVSLEALSQADWPAYQEFRPDFAAADWEQRRERQHRCFAVRSNGQILSASWVALGRAWIDYLGCELPLGPQEAYVYDAFTSAGWRGRSLGPALSAYITTQLLARGVCKSWRAVMPENRQAVALQAKLGSRPVMLLRSLRLGPWVWHSRNGGVPGRSWRP